MNARSAIVLILTLCGTLATAGSAQAQYGVQPTCGHGYGAWDVGRLYGVLAQNVPHYAAFPPVYYSAPIPRTYGYSPFAYPPGTRTPELAESPAPVEIVNPHFKASTKTENVEKPSDQVTRAEPSVRPLLVLNPFVGSIRTAALVD